MASLPIPAKKYFNDFSFDLVNYTVNRDSKVIGIFNGLTNTDENGQHISFLMDATINVGDVLTSTNKSYVIKSVEYDTYQGNPDLIKAYF